MIKFNISLFFICFFYCAQSQTPADFFLPNEVVYGKVLKIYQATAVIPPGDTPEAPQNAKFEIGKMIDFNAQGQSVTVREMMPDGYELSKTEYSYNDTKGYLEIRQKNEGYPPAQYRHRVENGKLIESILLDTTGKMMQTTIRNYNEKGILEQAVTTDTTGQEINRVTYTYEFDDQGNWTKEILHDQQTDQYKIRTQSIVYQGKNGGVPTEKALQGIWYGWLNPANLFVLDGKYAMLKTEKTNMESHAFRYDMPRGAFSLSNAFSTTTSFTASYDGQVLILRQSASDRVLYFTKNAPDKNSAAEPALYQYGQKPEIEFIAFQEGKLRGIKTKDGNILLKAEYEDTYRANNQLVKAKKNGKWALFNNKGKQLTEFRFQEVRREDENYLVCTDSIKALFTPDGKKILQGPYVDIKIMNNKAVRISSGEILGEKRQGIFDLNGQVVLPIAYRSIDFLDKTGESGAIALRDQERVQTVWFDKNFQEIRTFQGQVAITPLGGNFFLLHSSQRKSMYNATGTKILKDDGSWRLKGMLDLSGNIIIEPVYEDLRFVSAHLIAAKKAGKFGLVDRNGKEVTPFVYDNIISQNLKKEGPVDIEFDIKRHLSAALFVKDGDFGYLNGYGKEIKPILTPTYIRQQRSKTGTLPGLVTFQYPYPWKQLADMLQSGAETGNALIRVKSVPYAGELAAWLQKNYPNQNWLPTEIAGKPAYASVEIKKANIKRLEEEFRSQVYYVPVDEDTALQLSFDCATLFYPYLAQNFFDIINTLQF